MEYSMMTLRLKQFPILWALYQVWDHRFVNITVDEPGARRLQKVALESPKSTQLWLSKATRTKLKGGRYDWATGFETESAVRVPVCAGQSLVSAILHFGVKPSSVEIVLYAVVCVQYRKRRGGPVYRRVRVFRRRDKMSFTDLFRTPRWR